jgi:hypothetical protein
MKRSSFAATATTSPFNFAACSNVDSTVIKSDNDIKTINDFKSRYPNFYANHGKCATSPDVANINNIFSDVLTTNCKSKNGTLSEGDGYNYYKVHQVYSEFFKHPLMCLSSLGTLVQDDPQFLLYMLSYSFGFSKNMLEFIRLNNPGVYTATLDIAISYFKVVGPILSSRQSASESISINQANLKTVLDYEIQYMADPLTISIYYDLYRRFQGIVEDRFSGLKLITTSIVGYTTKVNGTIQGVIESLMGNTVLDLSSSHYTSNLNAKITKIYSYNKTMTEVFNSLLHIFDTDLNKSLIDMNKNIGNKRFLENVAEDQLIMDFSDFAVKMAKDEYQSTYDMFSDTIKNANMESTFFYFAMLGVLHSHALGRMLIQILDDIKRDPSDYFNSDGTVKSVNGTDISKVLDDVFVKSGGMVKIYKRGSAGMIKYMNYLNNYLLGMISTNANTGTLLRILSLPNTATIEDIYNTIYIKLVYQVRQLCNTYIVTTPDITLGNDPLEIYDFPYDFRTFLASVRNKKNLLKTISNVQNMEALLNMAKSGMVRTSTTPARISASTFGRISKSRFGEVDDENVQDSDDATYSNNLILLERKLNKVSPDVESIRTLVTETNNITSQPLYSYGIILSHINTLIEKLNDGITDSNLKIQLLSNRDTAAPDPVLTAPTVVAVKQDNNLSLYLLILLIVLIGLFILINFMNKKKY